MDAGTRPCYGLFRSPLLSALIARAAHAQSCTGSSCVTNGGPVALSANAACATVQGFVTLAASDAANPLGYTVAVAPQSTCSMLSRSSGSLRCAPAKLTTAYAGEPVFFVGRSEDIPLDLMSSGPVGGSCSA